MKNTNQRLFFIIIVISLIFKLTVNAQTKWRFAVVGDTHVGSTDTIAEMVPYMIADGIECLLLPGDIAEGGLASSSIKLQGQLERWQSLLAPLYDKGIGVYPIYGNHENDAKNNSLAWNNVFTGKYLLPQNGPTGEENFTYSFTHKNALFIALDTYKDIHKINQVWLNQQLSQNTKPHIFVYGHEAAFKVFHADCLDDSLSARNTFWDSLSKAGVKIYFCGHDHFLDISKVDDGDGNAANDVLQYLVGTGGGWLMSQYSNYNGVNTPYTPKRLFHEMEFGYSVVEISGEGDDDLDVTITWKKRTYNSTLQKNEYLSTSNVVSYKANAITGLHAATEQTIKVFPNPTSNSLTISGVTGSTSITNSLGRLVWKGNIEHAISLNIDSYQNGIYFVQNNADTQKFIIQK